MGQVARKRWLEVQGKTPFYSDHKENHMYFSWKAYLADGFYYSGGCFSHFPNTLPPKVLTMEHPGHQMETSGVGIHEVTVVLRDQFRI